MPLILKGGIRERQKKTDDAPHTLLKRIKTRWREHNLGTRIVRREVLEELGRGGEGKVQKVRLTIQNKKGRTRTIVLAEKTFTTKKPSRAWGAVDSGSKKKKNRKWTPVIPETFGKPKRQFIAVEKLARINREKKLGLRLPTTVRIANRWPRRARLYTTIVNDGEHQHPLDRHTIAFENDRQRQMQIARNNGFYIHGDAFLETQDPQTGEPIAVIRDLGNIRVYEPGPSPRQNRRRDARST